MRDYKFTLNPYSGCSFACDYCYARFFSSTLEEQGSWGAWVKVKANSLTLLEEALHAGNLERRLEPGDAVYMSSVTDPYQPIEQKIQLTRSILERLVHVQPRLTIQTRSPIATRDIDLFAKFERIRVNFTVTTDSEEVRRRYEPHCPSIDVRFKSAEAVRRAGVPIGISISPMLPVRDAGRFADRVAALNAVEYVTQFVKPTRPRFSAGTTPEVLEKLREDNWSHAEYQRVRGTLQRVLGRHRLLEGNEGYAPPP